MTVRVKQAYLRSAAKGEDRDWWHVADDAGVAVRRRSLLLADASCVVTLGAAMSAHIEGEPVADATGIRPLWQQVRFLPGVDDSFKCCALTEWRPRRCVEPAWRAIDGALYMKFDATGLVWAASPRYCDEVPRHQPLPPTEYPMGKPQATSSQEPDWKARALTAEDACAALRESCDLYRKELRAAEEALVGHDKTIEQLRADLETQRTEAHRTLDEAIAERASTIKGLFQIIEDRDVVIASFTAAQRADEAAAADAAASEAADLAAQIVCSKCGGTSTTRVEKHGRVFVDCATCGRLPEDDATRGASW